MNLRPFPSRPRAPHPPPPSEEAGGRRTASILQKERRRAFLLEDNEKDFQTGRLLLFELVRPFFALRISERL